MFKELFWSDKLWWEEENLSNSLIPSLREIFAMGKKQEKNHEDVQQRYSSDKKVREKKSWIYDEKNVAKETN